MQQFFLEKTCEETAGYSFTVFEVCILLEIVWKIGNEKSEVKKKTLQGICREIVVCLAESQKRLAVDNSFGIGVFFQVVFLLSTYVKCFGWTVCGTCLCLPLVSSSSS